MIIDTIATGEVKTVNLVDRKGTVMIDVMATMIGNDTRVVTEIIKAATADDRTTITTAATTTGRIPIPLPDAQREVAPGHGEIQSHARVVTNLLVVDTEAEIDQDHTGIHVAGKIGPEVGTEVLLRSIPVTGQSTWEVASSCCPCGCRLTEGQLGVYRCQWTSNLSHSLDTRVVMFE